MKKEHKLQRNLDSTFEAELKICSLSGLTTWCSEWSVWGLGMGLGADCQVHICLGVAPVGVRGGVGVIASGLQQAVLCCSLRPGPDGQDAGGVSGSSGSGAEHPAPQSAGASTEELPSPRVSAASLRTLRSLCLRPSFFWFCFFYLRLLCPRLRIRETTEKPTPMQTHQGLFTSSSLRPSTPDTTEQGLGPRSGF